MAAAEAADAWKKSFSATNHTLRCCPLVFALVQGAFARAALAPHGALCRHCSAGLHQSLRGCRRPGLGTLPTGPVPWYETAHCMNWRSTSMQLSPQLLPPAPPAQRGAAGPMVGHSPAPTSPNCSSRSHHHTDLGVFGCSWPPSLPALACNFTLPLPPQQAAPPAEPRASAQSDLYIVWAIAGQSGAAPAKCHRPPCRQRR